MKAFTYGKYGPPETLRMAGSSSPRRTPVKSW